MQIEQIQCVLNICEYKVNFFLKEKFLCQKGTHAAKR